MGDSIDVVLEAAPALGPADRARLAEKMLQSLGAVRQADIDAAWAAEAARRLQAYREERIESFSADEAFGSLLGELTSIVRSSSALHAGASGAE